MQIITQGDITRVHWWVGQTATCARCGTVVLLEAGDARCVYTDHSRALCEDYAFIDCPLCNDRCRVARSTRVEGWTQ